MSLQIGDLIPLMGLSDEEKQKLIDIVNNAEKNESSIKDNLVKNINALNGGVTLSNTNNWLDIISQIPNIKTGLRYAKGYQYPLSDSTLTINNLTFTPRIIILQSWYGDEPALKNKIVINDEKDLLFKVSSSSSFHRTGEAGYHGGTARSIGENVIFNNGFTVITPEGSYTKVKWIALE